MKLRSLVFLAALVTAFIVGTGCENASRDKSGVTPASTTRTEPQGGELPKMVHLQIVRGTDSKTVEPSSSRFWKPDEVIEGQLVESGKYVFDGVVRIPDPTMLDRESEPLKFLILSSTDTNIEMVRAAYTWLGGKSRGVSKSFTKSTTDGFWYVSLSQLYLDVLDEGIPKMAENELDIEVEFGDGSVVQVITKINARPISLDVDVAKVADGEDQSNLFGSPNAYSSWRVHGGNSLSGWRLLTEKITNPSSRKVSVLLSGELMPGSEIYSEISNHTWSWMNIAEGSLPDDRIGNYFSRVSQFEIWVKLVREPGNEEKNDFGYARVSHAELGFELSPGESVNLIWVVKPLGSSCSLQPMSSVELRHPMFLVNRRSEIRINGDVFDGIRSVIYWNRTMILNETDVLDSSKVKWMKDQQAYSVGIGNIKGGSVAHSCQGLF